MLGKGIVMRLIKGKLRPSLFNVSTKGTLVQSELTGDIQPPQFTFQISCIGCLRIAGALPFLIPFINSKFLFILFPTYNPIKLTSA
jgi:hypothetical protein